MHLLGIALTIASVVMADDPAWDGCGNRDGFFVTPVVSCGEARDACARYGGRLAAITIENIAEASRIAASCHCDIKGAWVRSWNGDKYEGACLALSIGPTGGLGTLNVLPGSQRHVMALCQKVVPGFGHRRRHHHHRPHHTHQEDVTKTVTRYSTSITTLRVTSTILTTSLVETTDTLTNTTTDTDTVTTTDLATSTDTATDTVTTTETDTVTTTESVTTTVTTSSSLSV
jgi:hypothetical protein